MSHGISRKTFPFALYILRTVLLVYCFHLQASQQVKIINLVLLVIPYGRKTWYKRGKKRLVSRVSSDARCIWHGCWSSVCAILISTVEVEWADFTVCYLALMPSSYVANSFEELLRPSVRNLSTASQAKPAAGKILL